MKLLNHFKELTVHPKNAQELKDLILQLAIQGKLTKAWREQNPDVEPASVLLKKVQEEKAQLIKEKKIKKEKPLPEVEEERLDHSIPTSWLHIRLGEIGDWGAGATPSRSHSEYYGGDVNWFKSGELNHGVMDYESKEKINELAIKNSSLRLNKVGDVLIAMYGATIGKTGLLAVEGATNQAVCACTPFSCITNVYLHLLLKALKDVFINQGEGGAQPNISRVKLRNQIISLPPLEEQKAIVATVNQLFKEVEALEEQTKARVQLKEDFVTSALQQLSTGDTVKEWSFLQAHFKTFFTEKSSVKKLRETILQLAVQGKLTKHWRSDNPDVEPASVLLEKIKAEKAQLIKDKKIKVEKKNVEPIDIEAMPYALPDSWIWSRMIQLCRYITDGTHQTPKYTEEGRMFLSAKNVKPFKFMPEKHRYVSEEDFEGYRRNRMPEINDILLTRVGAGIGEAALIDQDLEFAIYVSVGLLKMFPKLINPQYLVMWLNSPEGRQYSAINTYGKGVSQGNLNLSLIRRFAVSLPPFEEQNAIVEKVNALVGLCDALEKEIDHSTTQVEQLMQSCLKEVFLSDGASEKLGKVEREGVAH